MKGYIKQIYNEGLGLTLYKPAEQVINKIKNRIVKNILIILYKCIYFIVAITIAILLFLVTYPL